MGFDNKYYPNRKDRRKPYRGSKAFDASCRSHGGCPWCEENRKHRTRKTNDSANDQIKELKSVGRY